MENKKLPSCCQPVQGKKPKGLLQGVLYGLLPHTGCIAFVLITIFGVTAAASFFKPLMTSYYFFYGLVGLSFLFATIGAGLYLKKNQALSFRGIKQFRKYLTIMYGTTIGINLLLFTVIFPYTAGLSSFAVYTDSPTEKITLDVKIPCSGHAPLIINELKQVEGITGVIYKNQGFFDVTFDTSKTSESKILSQDIFKDFPARIIS